MAGTEGGEWGKVELRDEITRRDFPQSLVGDRLDLHLQKFTNWTEYLARSRWGPDVRRYQGCAAVET